MSGCQMVWNSNCGLKTGWTKHIYGPDCLVFEWPVKSCDPFEYRTPKVSGIWVSGIQMVTAHSTLDVGALYVGRFIDERTSIVVVIQCKMSKAAVGHSCRAMEGESDWRLSRYMRVGVKVGGTSAQKWLPVEVFVQIKTKNSHTQHF